MFARAVRRSLVITTTSDQADNMAKVTHPIQAWYATEKLGQ